MCEDLDPRRCRIGEVDPVVLGSDHSRNTAAHAQPGSGEQPVSGVADHEVGMHRIALVHATGERALRSRIRRRRPVRGHGGVVDAVQRVLGRDLVTGFQPVRPERGRSQPNSSEHRVRAQESQIHPALTGPRQRVPHRGRIVLVMPHGNDRAGAVQQRWIAVEVDIRCIGDGQPEFLGEDDDRGFVSGEVRGAVAIVVRSVERDDPGPVVESLRAVVKAVSTPRVVCLPGCHRREQYHPSRCRRVADGQRNVGLETVGVVQAHQIRARRPAARVERRCRHPGRAHGAGFRVARGGGLYPTG